MNMIQTAISLQKKTTGESSPGNLRLALFPIKEVRPLTNETFVLVTARNGMDFIPGQRVKINLMYDDIKRPYSIYSGNNSDRLEFLIREVPNGSLTPRLKPLCPGDKLEIIGPNGHFSLHKTNSMEGKHLFIASGTGIAPFHSMIQSHPGLNYKLLHGVGYANDAYEKESYDPSRIVVCTSRDNLGNYKGRVTGYLKENDEEFDHVYLCGNSHMIADATEILLKKGYHRNQIHTEIYF
jgi:ferredoxin/flavodoxin---NADP+ reductase